MKQQEKKLSTKKGEISSKLVVEKTIKERARELLKKLEVHYKVKDKVHYRDLVGDKNLTLITKALKQTEERVIGEIRMEEMVWAEPLVGSELETWNRAVKYFNDKINKLKKI